MTKRAVGAHLSVAGGLNKGVDRAVAIKANALQIFAGSPRSWQPKTIVPAELKDFKKYAFDNQVRTLFIHALYLINLASDNKEIVQKSIKLLIHNLKIGDYFGCQGVVVHLGSHQGRGWEASKDRLIVLIKKVLQESGGQTPLLLENSAGQKGKLNSELGEIRWLIDQVGDQRLGWCYDTCHGWAAGYSPTQGSQNPLTEIERLDLWDSLKCLHVNDSRDELGSGRDRHDNIGEGKIPTEDFVQILNHPKLRSVPIITEAPGFDGNGPDAENISRIRQLLK